MLGLFGLFGRSREHRVLDRALRKAGVHPQTVPEAVKLAAFHIVKDDPGTGDAALLLAYCMLGRDAFIESNGVRAAQDVEGRMDSASDGDVPDAKLILLALHSNIAVPEVAEQFDVETR